MSTSARLCSGNWKNKMSNVANINPERQRIIDADKRQLKKRRAELGLDQIPREIEFVHPNGHWKQRLSGRMTTKDAQDFRLKMYARGYALIYDIASPYDPS